MSGIVAHLVLLSFAVVYIVDSAIRTARTSISHRFARLRRSSVRHQDENSAVVNARFDDKD